MTTLKKTDGTQTRDLLDTLNLMIDSFIPQDDEETDNNYHKERRDEAKAPIETADDKLFTTTEIYEVMEGMDKNKAPGEDGITSDILRRAFNVLPQFMTSIFNGCLRTACFPRKWKKARII